MKTIYIPLVFLSLASYAQSTCVISDAKAFHVELDTYYGTPLQSPLTPSDLAQFKGLAFYRPAKKYQVQATLIPTPDAAPFEMKTTTARKPLYRQYGVLQFTLHRQTHQVPVYQSGDATAEDRELFFPFTDLTNGETTYKGGRYINLQIPEQGNQLCLDFNQAYNPYCAYNSKYSCPVVPEANHLPVAVKAGVKKFK